MNLNQNQKILAIVIALIVIGGVAFLYQNANQKSAPTYGTANTPAALPEPLPKNVDGITDAIISETMADQAALDQEAAGEDAQIQEDSQSVNDLGNAYDENSY